MLELHVSNSEITDGSAVITWCVSELLLAELADQKIVNPQLVICVAPEGDAYSIKKEYRTVVSLKELMTYINFRVPGPNKIWGFIHWDSKRETQNKFLTKTYGEFHTSILNYSGDNYSLFITDQEKYRVGPLSKYKSSFIASPLLVDVPKECFAAEPSDLEKSWVNHFHHERPTDQCEFRRRRLFAYTIQPVIMFLNLLLRFTFLIMATLIGSRGWSLKYILHPLIYDLNSSGDVLKGGSIFIRNHNYDDNLTLSHFVRTFWALPFMPLVMIFFGLMWFFNAFWILGVIISVLTIIFVTIAIEQNGALRLFYLFCDKVDGWLNKDEEMWYNEDEASLLVCNGEKKIRKFSDLPKQHRTLKLRFLDLKSRVCRPFSA